ncbi:hypothetical protein C7S20_06100 [Christiangramia fulva]|uniref:Uncharacterized protein n=1 Tax=Christiangramia fulva TaxID=2126553 RepID=A0A2R3Z3T7_9FLAO|nr:hypothetical protein [Christiangramia fulva]AVR44872.1 hypothetical protein C7S20_06100 [Christiangramia fulva]
MKASVLLFSGIFSLLFFGSCGGNKNLQERAPAQFGKIYTTKTPKGIRLNIPVIAIQDQKVSLNSVYFRGMKSALTQNEEKPNLYVADFRTGMGDIVMHKEPKKEYGNQPPQMPEKSPVKIEKDEALLVFIQNGETKYYKLTGIVEKE